jgi:hypothetical protein
VAKTPSPVNKEEVPKVVNEACPRVASAMSLVIVTPVSSLGS